MKRKGFTLVELLIVIAIIGVLAAMMTLSSSDATIAAKAASVANGYKVVGSAYAVYAAVSGDSATASHFQTVASKDYLGAHVRNFYKYKVESDENYVYVSFDVATDTKLKAKFLTISADMGMQGNRLKVY